MSTPTTRPPGFAAALVAALLTAAAGCHKAPPPAPAAHAYTDDTGRVASEPLSELFGAIQRDDGAAVEAALGREPRLLAVTVNGGWAPLHAAAQVGAEKATRALLAAGASREARFQGKSPLGLALAARKTAVAKLLIEGKARIDDVDGEGHTALHLAAQKGLVDVVGYLLDHGVNINERSHNRYGVTALQDAALEGQVETVRLLLSRGADPNVVGTFGYTALDDAHDNAAIAALLKQHGARPGVGQPGAPRR
jgi:ankyrin repeat protein